jgi:hypothetical protein
LKYRDEDPEKTGFMGKTKEVLCQGRRVKAIVGLQVAIFATSNAHAWQLASNLTVKADLALKETFDSNVYLQDVDPNPAVTNAVKPFQESFVTSVIPRLALDWKPMPEFNLSAFYAPEVVRFHAEPSENHESHRGALNFSGNVGIVSWEQFNTLTWIDGSEEGLTFGGPGGAPAIGGIPIRDRRAALIYRNGFRAFHPHGNWFFRPVAWSYVHDFRTDTRSRTQFPFYQNYVDRNDFTVGLETGYKAFKNAYLVVGYRYGFQDETPLPGEAVHYSNEYHRVVAGLEGQITRWLKITGVIGPDWRDYAKATPPGFDEHHTSLYYDASIVITPTKRDAITLLARQFEQPAFGAPSAYEDITWEINWRHVFEARFSVTTGFRAYGGDWLSPVMREDWIFTPTASLSYTHNKHLSGELSYSYDWVDSRVPDTSGREFTRHLVSLGMKYAF